MILVLTAAIEEMVVLHEIRKATSEAMAGVTFTIVVKTIVAIRSLTSRMTLSVVTTRAWSVVVLVAICSHDAKVEWMKLA